MTIFDLKPGEKFELSGRVYKILEFKRERRPRLGACLVCVTKNDAGNRSHFLTDFEIKKV